MVSEVNGPPFGLVKGLGQSGAKADTTAGPAQPARTGATHGADIVTLTDLAARLQQLTRAVEDIPIVDPGRVEVFKHAVAKGTYTIDTRAIAEKLAAPGMSLAVANEPA